MGAVVTWVLTQIRTNQKEIRNNTKYILGSTSSMQFISVCANSHEMGLKFNQMGPPAPGAVGNGKPNNRVPSFMHVL